MRVRNLFVDRFCLARLIIQGANNEKQFIQKTSNRKQVTNQKQLTNQMTKNKQFIRGRSDHNKARNLSKSSQTLLRNN